MRRIVMLVSLAAMAVVVLFSGCAILDDVVGEIVGSAVEESTRSMMGDLTAFSDVMLFQLAYFQVFFVGGFGSGIEDFRDGEGVTWEAKSGDGEDGTSFVGERALLRRNGDGTQWWYIAYRTGEDQAYEYEVLMDADYDPVEMYWPDQETGDIRHHIFEQDEEGETDEADEPEQEQLEAAGASPYVFDEDDYGETTRERVEVSVPAGRYTADYIVHEYTDEESGDTVEYHWWVVEEVPGDLVKYEYIDRSDEDEAIVSGELIEVRSNYRSRFGSF